ncbi:MAG: hypothetical protein KDC67_14675, partial [Ignavibacteriae bacterium]|nr:hypothetical protein [Ignavibacteriota bacterium]
MKLLFVGSESSLNIDRVGGIESTMFELINFLIRKKHDVKIIIIDNVNTNAVVKKFATIDISYTQMNSEAVRKEILNNYDAVNFLQTPFENIFFALYFMFLKLTRKVYSTKFYFTYDSLNNSNYLQKVKLKLLINRTFVFSKRLEKNVKRITNNVTLLTPPVADYYFNIKRLDKSEKEKILFVGRISKDKGIDVVIEVFKNLPREKYLIN